MNMRYRFLPTYRYYEAEGYPISLGKTAGKPLRNYRIYGNTVDGVSCGDKTKNLLDIRNGSNKTERGITYTNNKDGTITLNGTFNSTTYTYYQLKNYVSFESGKTYILGCGQESNNYGVRMYIMVGIKNADTGSTRYVSSDGVNIFTLANNEAVTLFEFRTALRDTSVFPTLTNVVLTPFAYEGERESVYEPYGYKMPLQIDDNSAQNIYLDQPLRSIGDYFDFVDYKEQTLSRVIQRFEFTGNESWKETSDYIYISKSGVSSKPNVNNSVLPGETYFIPVGNVIRVYNYDGSLEEWVQYLKDNYASGTPVWVECIMKTTTVSDITLPVIPTQKHQTNLITVQSNVPPSKIWCEYYK